MKIKIPSLTPTQVEISAEASGGQLLSVNLRFRKGKVARTEEVAEMVFADYDKGGNLLALESAEPESCHVSLTGKLARKLHIPLPELNRRAFRILAREMGVPDTLRFFGQFWTGSGDYTQERKLIFEGLTLEEYRQGVSALGRSDEVVTE